MSDNDNCVICVEEQTKSVESTVSNEEIEKKEYTEINVEFKGDSFREDNEYYYVKAYASTYDQDLVGDIIEKGAFKKTLKSRIPKVLGYHNTQMPVGGHISGKEDDNGLYIECRIPKDGGNTPFIVPYVKCGAVSAMSIGFIVKDYSINKKGLRVLKEIDLFEYSFVTFPANPEAKIVDIKSCLGNIRYVESVLKKTGFSRKQAKALLAGGYDGLSQCDAESNYKNVRDAHSKQNPLDSNAEVKKMLEKIRGDLWTMKLKTSLNR